jgi:predicted O-methyltransferase YrrM
MTVATQTKVVPQAPEVLGAIERALVAHSAFGDSRYISDRLWACLRYRLERLAGHSEAARELLDACDGAGSDGLEHVLGDTVVRCSILHAHIQLETPDVSSYALPVEDCELVLAATARHVREGKRDTPLSDGSLCRLGPDADHPWLWSDEHPDDLFGRCLRYLLKQRYNAIPVAPTDAEQAQVTRGIQLLEELLPDLAPSVLRHAHTLALVPSAGLWTNVASASQFDLGGTIFLGRSSLTPWWVAEHVFHEALHQKLYDFRHGHTLLDLDAAHETRLPVCALWNPPRLNKANQWHVHRVYAAFHVYAHLTLFAMLVEQREKELAREYGPVRDTVDSLRAFERAWYLGERLKQECWELLGSAGRQMVEWLLAALEFMNPSTPPPGADIHLYLDRYVRESREAERALRDARSDPVALAERLGPLARDEVDGARALLASIGAHAPLERIESAAGSYAEGDLGARFPQIRVLIAEALSDAAHDRYRLTESAEHDERLRALVEDGSDRFHPLLAGHPPAVAAGRRRATELGFGQSCSDDVGRLLAVLAGAVPRDGRILELGTAVGVGTAWITSGLGARSDVEVVSVESNERLSDAARAWPWPPYVAMVSADGREAIGTLGTFDLVFADAAPIKYGHIETVLAALRPRGLLVIDDTHIGSSATETAREQLDTLRRFVSQHPELTSVELDWASGVIVASRSDL